MYTKTATMYIQSKKLNHHKSGVIFVGHAAVWTEAMFKRSNKPITTTKRDRATMFHRKNKKQKGELTTLFLLG